MILADRPRPGPLRRAAPARPRRRPSWPTRRRAAPTAPRCARRPPPRPVRGRHRGGQRGRRLLDDRRRPARLPAADRGEGPRAGCGSSPTAGPGTARRSTTTTPSPGSARRWPGSAPTRGRWRSPRRSAPSSTASRRSPASRSTPTTRTPSSRRSAPRRASSARRCATRPTPPLLEAGYKHNVDPRDGDARWSTAASCPAARSELVGDGPRARRARAWTSRRVHRGRRPRDARSAATSSTRWSPRWPAEDPGAAVLPYCLSGGTDNKNFSEPGIVGYGFAPLRLPAGPGLRRDVPRRRRARAGRRAAVRRPDPRALPAHLLNHDGEWPVRGRPAPAVLQSDRRGRRQCRRCCPRSPDASAAGAVARAVAQVDDVRLAAARGEADTGSARAVGP